MTATKRFLSGSAASWARVILNVGTQFALVPIFLSHWSVEEYGCWLVIASVTGLASLFSIGHQSFLEYEFLRVGDKNPQQLSLLFYSSIPFALLLCLLELILVAGAIFFGWLDAMFDSNTPLDQHLLNQSFWAMIVFSLGWLVNTGIGGLGGRLVSPFGHFPRFAWWSFALALSTAVASAIAVYVGAGLLDTAIAVTLTSTIINIPIHMDLWRLFKQHHLNPIKPDLKMGANLTIKSMALALTNVIENLRQQGIRVFLSTIVGLSQMTAFSTTRTISNVSLQGMSTVTTPAMPEFMRYLREKDGARVDSVMGFLLFLTVIVFAPILVGLQLIIPDIFLLWTRGKIEFDGFLFGLFSISLMIYAIGRPLFAIIQGNNLVKSQLIISTTVGLIAIVGVIFMSTYFGIRGAAAALLFAEITGCILALIYALKWLSIHQMQLPYKLFYLAGTSILMATFGILLMAAMPEKKLMIFSCVFILCALLGYVFVRQLPKIALDKLETILLMLTRQKRAL